MGVCALWLTRHVCHPNQGEPVAAAFIKPSLGCPHAESTHTHIHMNTHSPPPGYMSGAQPVWGRAHTHRHTHTPRTHTTPLAIRVYMGPLLLHFNEWRCSFSTLFLPALSFTCGVKARCGLLWYTAGSYHWTTGVNLELNTRSVSVHVFVPKIFRSFGMVRMCTEQIQNCFNHCTSGTSLKTSSFLYCYFWLKTKSHLSNYVNPFQEIQTINAILTLFDVAWQIAV